MFRSCASVFRRYADQGSAAEDADDVSAGGEEDPRGPQRRRGHVQSRSGTRAGALLPGRLQRGLWRRVARQRSHPPESRQYRQRSHVDPRFMVHPLLGGLPTPQWTDFRGLGQGRFRICFAKAAPQRRSRYRTAARGGPIRGERANFSSCKFRDKRANLAYRFRSEDALHAVRPRLPQWSNPVRNRRRPWCYPHA